MTAATAPPPARSGFDLADALEPDRRDWLRLVGGVLLAAGFAVLYIRKFEAWGDFPLLLVALIPAVILYGLGWLGGVRPREGGLARPEGWQVVFLIVGSLLAGVVMAQLLLLLGADNLEARLHQVLLGLAVAAAAFAASFLRNVPVLALVGGLAALWAWIFLWDKIVEVDSIGTGRAFLLIFAVLMLAAAFALRSLERPQVSDFIAVAGVTALVAGLLSLSGLANQFNPLSENDDTRPTEAWNVFILVISLALIAYGARAPSRGPSYVGAIGLASFVGLAGSNIVALAAGHFDDREKLAGWPLLLLVLGIGALVASFFLPREGAARRGPATGPEGAPQPGAGYGPPPGQAPGGGGYAPAPGQAPPPTQPGREAWPPPGQQGGATPPSTPQPPAGDATQARPIPPPPPGDATQARPIPPPPPADRPTDPGQQPPPG